MPNELEQKFKSKQTWTAELLLDLPVWDLLSLATLALSINDPRTAGLSMSVLWASSWSNSIEIKQLPLISLHELSRVAFFIAAFSRWESQCLPLNLSAVSKTAFCLWRLREDNTSCIPFLYYCFSLPCLLAKLSGCFSLSTEILLSTLIFNSLSFNFLGRFVGSVSGLLVQ